jgi:hypothetical protein
MFCYNRLFAAADQNDPAGFARREVRDGGNGYVSVEVPLGDRDGDRRRPRKLFANA